jgi:hypothetical protein
VNRPHRHPKGLAVRCSPFVLAGLVAGLLFAAPASAGTSHNVDATLEGAVTRTGSTVVSAFLTRSTALGEGAGRLAIRQREGATTDGTGTVYTARGSLRFRVTLTFEAPANNRSPFTGRLTVTRGTGRFRGATGTLEVEGEQDLQALAFTGKATGRLTY